MYLEIHEQVRRKFAKIAGYFPRPKRPGNQGLIPMKTAQELRSGNVIMVGKDPMVVLKAEYNKGGRNAGNRCGGQITIAERYLCQYVLDDLKCRNG